MRNIFCNIFISCLFVLFLSSCSGTHDETILKEDQSIESFINNLISKGIVNKVYFADGVNHAMVKNGDKSQSVNNGDSVYFNFVAYFISSSTSATIYETNIKEVAQKEGLDLDSRVFKPLGTIAGEGKLVSGLDKGLKLCCLNESSYLLFNSDLAYGSKPFGMIPAYSPIMFYVEIVKIKKN